MRIDIISAGPGATRAKPLGYVLAVNRAALKVECDAIVAGDTRTLVDMPLTDKPLWTMKNQIPIPAAWSRVLRFDLLPGWTDLGKPANWSIQGAIAAAAHMGENTPTWIHLWGIDAYWSNPTDPADVSGYAGPDADRTPERWKREREDIDRSISWAQRLGHTITLHQ